jgi:unsaturated rhamnogalacturonyl hydrolase
VKNGLDVWTKRVRTPIIDKWYDGDSLKGKARISYHVDHGEGADMFEVGRSLGAGACAILKDSTLYQPGLFTMQTIAAIGPIRAQFVVLYEQDTIDGKPFTEEKTYTLDAGHNLNRIDVRYTGSSIPKHLSIAAGLVKRKNTVQYSHPRGAWLSLWGRINDDTTNGYLGTGVVFPQKSFKAVKEDSTQCLIIGTTESAKTFTYYAGAGWTRSGDFAGVEDWNKYLAIASQCIQAPLKITITGKSK